MFAKSFKQDNYENTLKVTEKLNRKYRYNILNRDYKNTRDNYRKHLEKKSNELFLAHQLNFKDKRAKYRKHYKKLINKSYDT